MKELILAAAASALLLAAAPAMQDGTALNLAEAGLLGDNASSYGDYDTMLEDPDRDPAHPARNRQLLVPSHGVGLNALFLLAAGDKPKPTMLLLHGLPGNEQNLDLAQAIRRKGWNVLTLHYRGSWGSPGSFSIANAIADAEAAMAFLRTPEAAAEYRIDTGRLAIAGHSMGALAAAHYAAKQGPARAGPGPVPPGMAAWPGSEQTDGLVGVLLLDAWNPGVDAAELARGGPEAMRRYEAGIDDLGNSLQGATAASLAAEVRDRGAAMDLRELAPALARRRLFTIYATHGGRADNLALAEAVAAACPERGESMCGGRLWLRELDSDHGFADKRLALTAWVIRWLDHLGPWRPVGMRVEGPDTNSVAPPGSR